MNNIKYYITIGFALLLTACNESFLDIQPQDRITVDNFYNTEAQVKSATASLYGVPWFDFNDKFHWLTGDVLAGNIYYTYDQEGQFFYFTYNEGNSHLSSGWQSLFRVVSYANAIINDMPAAAEGKVSDDVINRALGEAHFIRAAAYYFLAENWEDVPIVENSKDPIVNNQMALFKNKQSSIYEFMRRDLEFAAANLPKTEEKGRVTQWSAKGMLAKLYVTMAQHRGESRANEYFATARDYAADVIENSGLTLMTSYEDLFKAENNNNSESLFALQWIAGAYGSGNSRQANWARSSIITGNTECWGGGKSFTYDFVQQVEQGDLRRRSIYMTKDDFYPEINKAAGGYTYHYAVKDPGNPDNYLENSGPVLNNAKKYILGSADDTKGQVSTNQSTGINTYVLRLADVYLLYAEAVLGNQSITTDGKALSYVNALRSRANVPAKTSLTFEDILKERRIELGGESLYWYDLKRYYYRDPDAAINNLNGQLRGHTYVKKDNAPDETVIAAYDLTPPESPIEVHVSQMKLPIPAGDIANDANLAPSVPAVDYEFPEQ